MKTKEELEAITKELISLNNKLAELTDDEIALVSGGVNKQGKSLSDDSLDSAS